MAGREAERRPAAVRHASRFRDFSAGWSAAPALDSADAVIKGKLALQAGEGLAARFPDRPRGPRGRSGGEFFAEDARGAAGSLDPDHDGRERLRSAADHSVAFGSLPFQSALE